MIIKARKIGIDAVYIHPYNRCIIRRPKVNINLKNTMKPLEAHLFKFSKKYSVMSSILSVRNIYLEYELYFFKLQ